MFLIPNKFISDKIIVLDYITFNTYGLQLAHFRMMYVYCWTTGGGCCGICAEGVTTVCCGVGTTDCTAGCPVAP